MSHKSKIAEITDKNDGEVYVIARYSTDGTVIRKNVYKNVSVASEWRIINLISKADWEMKRFEGKCPITQHIY